MRGVNKVTLIGNLVRDPETRYMANGSAVTNITIATNESWIDKQTGEKKEQAEFHRVVFYGKLAEIAGEYLKKGATVYAEGSIHYRKYQDKQTGQDKYSTEIKAVSMQMLDSRNSGGSAGHDSESAQSQQVGFGGAQGNNAPADDFDDDIPF